MLLEDWLNEKDTAAEVGVSVRTLRQWRRKGEGPPYTHFGRAIRYNKRALAAHFETLQVMPVRVRKRRVHNNVENGAR